MFPKLKVNMHFFFQKNVCGYVVFQINIFAVIFLYTLFIYTSPPNLS